MERRIRRKTSSCLPSVSALEMADWSRLPYDIIVLIANQLPDVEDFVSFSAVCRSWWLVYLNKDWMPSQRNPWLMIGECCECDVQKIKFFSISNLKLFKLPLPEAHGYKSLATWHGWIVKFGQDYVISLLNPITQVCINLPSLSMLASQLSAQADLFVTIRKTIVLKHQKRLVTFVVYRYHRCLAFCRTGDYEWTPVQSFVPVHFLHVVCFKDQIFAVTVVGTLMLLEIDGPNRPHALCVASPPEVEKGWQNLYLVESSDDLLLVINYGNWNMHIFKVYKFDISKRKWSLVNELGDRFLLVDYYGCISGSAYGCFKPSCIYSVEEKCDAVDSFWSMRYVTVYNIKDESTGVLRINDYFSSRCTNPVWMMPTLW